MKILAIESSCDETSAAIAEKKSDGSITILSNVVATSLELHATTGGIIPEVAARRQIEYIIPVISDAFEKASTGPEHIDAVAVTYGPGLIGSLLVGVETAKTLSYIWNKPIIPVNHLYGHLYANFIGENPKSKIQNPKIIEFPAIGLIVSGAHTDLVLMKDETTISWLGGTRDDAAGEAFDKIGRLLGLPYPAGPLIEANAKLGNPKSYHFPRPLKYDKAYDFSFSGLKTAVLREVQKIHERGDATGDPARVPALNGSEGSHRSGVTSGRTPSLLTNDLCRATQDAIIDVLVYKTLQAAEEFSAKSILLGGGVAANETLRETFELNASRLTLTPKVFVPQKSFCTDNAAMIAAAAFFHPQTSTWQDITANPELYFDDNISHLTESASY